MKRIKNFNIKLLIIISLTSSSFFLFNSLTKVKLQYLSYNDTGQALPISLETVEFQKSPKCKNTGYTYYIKSHFISGEKRRDLIRSSWGRDENLVFLTCGGFKSKNTRISIDDSTNKTTVPDDYYKPDMLIINGIHEDRTVLSFKITIALFHANSCQKFSQVQNHIIITDDDVFFWTEKLENDINKIWNAGTIQARGHIRYNDSPIRPDSFLNKYINPIFNPTVTRYGISKTMFLHDTLPPYFIGAGYIISNKAVSVIGKQLATTRLLWQVDDAYFGLLLHDAKVRIVDDAGFISFEEHKFVQSSKPALGVPFRLNLFGIGKYNCDSYNFHGYVVNEVFMRVKNDQCAKSSMFHMSDRMLNEFKIDF